MTAPTPLRRFRIVVALDRSEYAEIVLEHGIDQAARHEVPDLHVMTVVADAAEVEDARIALAAMVLDSIEALGAHRAQTRSQVHVVVGDPVEEIAGFAGDVTADLLVLGRFGVHERRGSIADRVLELAPCPTLVVNLKDDTIGPPQCPDCVAIRARTGAEQLFCAAHSSDRDLHLTDQVHWLSSPRGGSIW